MNARGIVAVIALILAAPSFAGTLTRTSAFEYDPTSGQLVREVIEPDNSALCLVTTYAYDTYGNRTSSTTRNCNGTSSGGLTEAAAPTGDPVFTARTSSSAFAAGSVVINGITYSWSAGQFATSSTNALGQTESRTFDPRFGGAASLIGPNGITINWSYDSFGRKSSESRADGTVTSSFYERCADITGACPALGQYRARVTATGAPTSSTYYDSLNREVRAETQGFDGTLARKDTQYDSLGRVAQVSRPYYASASAVWIVVAYDVLGRVVQTDEPSTTNGQLRTVTAYNGLVTTITISNADAGTNMPGGVTQTKTTTNNSQGQQIQVKDTQNNLLTYTYDELGNLKTTTDALGNVTTLSYDLRGRKTQMIDPDMGTWVYFYNALGELIRQTDAKNQTATMAYDLLGRMTSRTEPDLVSTWTYDSCTKGIGKLCQASATNGYSRTNTYDSLGRPFTLAATVDTSYTITTTYDSAGRVNTVTYPTGFALQNIYNGFGYLWKVQRSDAGGSTVFWTANTKDASGRVTSELLGNNLTQTRGYDPVDRLTSVVASGTGGTVHNFGYSYDNLGNLASRNDSVDAVTENFSYDNLNRLITASGPGLVTRSFDYNVIGNMIYKSDVGTYTYPASGAGSVRPHAVSSVSGTVNATYTYDANGNLLSGAGRTLTYMSFNMPATITGSAATYTYTYNPEHERVKLITQLQTGTQTSIYLHPGGGGALFYEKEIKPDTSLEHKHYVNAGSLLVGVYVTKSSYQSGDGPQMRYYHRDHLGSIMAISNEAGAVIERLSYEAFGKRRFPNGTADPSGSIFGITTDRGFTAHEHLDELGLIHMNGRVYDPLVARFMTPDLFIQAPTNLQSYNRYSYVMNNPLAFTDPSGHFSLRKAIHKVAHSLANYARAEAKFLLMPTLKNTFDAFHAIPGMYNVDNFIMRNQYAYMIAQTAAGYFGGPLGAAVFTAYMGYESTGSVNAGVKSAAISLATSAAMDVVGGLTNGHGVTSDYFGSAEHLANIAGHAAVGCASAAASGGSCRAGAFSGAAGSLVTPYGADLGKFGGLVVATISGGTASVIAGGKFTDGARTAAFGYLFNQAAAGLSREVSPEERQAMTKEFNHDIELMGVTAKLAGTVLNMSGLPEIGVALDGVGLVLENPILRQGYAESLTQSVVEGIRSFIQDTIAKDAYTNIKCSGCAPGL